MKEKLKSARDRLLDSLPKVTEDMMADVAAFAINRVLTSDTNVVAAGPSTLAACVGFLVGRADKDLGTRHFTTMAVAALTTGTGQVLDLKYLLKLENTIAAAYSQTNLTNPPTIRQFLSHGEL